jgi:hypothetical protein
MTREDLPDVVEKALRELGGRARVVDVAKKFGRNTNPSFELLETFFILGSMTCDGRLKRSGTLTN